MNKKVVYYDIAIIYFVALFGYLAMHFFSGIFQDVVFLGILGVPLLFLAITTNDQAEKKQYYVASLFTLTLVAYNVFTYLFSSTIHTATIILITWIVTILAAIVILLLNVKFKVTTIFRAELYLFILFGVMIVLEFGMGALFPNKTASLISYSTLAIVAIATLGLIWARQKQTHNK